ncbi:MAG: hypothetical protein R6V54_09940 [Desulfobacteraceae bacterium]
MKEFKMPPTATGINGSLNYQTQIFQADKTDSHVQNLNKAVDPKKPAYDVEITAKARQLDQKLNREKEALGREYTTEKRQLEAEYKQEKEKVEAEYRQKKKELGINFYA